MIERGAKEFVWDDILMDDSGEYNENPTVKTTMKVERSTAKKTSDVLNREEKNINIPDPTRSGFEKVKQKGPPNKNIYLKNDTLRNESTVVEGIDYGIERKVTPQHGSSSLVDLAENPNNSANQETNRVDNDSVSDIEEHKSYETYGSNNNPITDDSNGKVNGGKSVKYSEDSEENYDEV